MKIALVIERLDPTRGGREASTAQIAQRLACLGHSVCILCQQGHWPDNQAQVELVQLGLSSPAKFAAEVRRATAGGRFDITHAMLPIPGADIYQLRSGTIPAQVAASLRRVNCPMCRLAKRLGRMFNPRRRRSARMERLVASDSRTLCMPSSRMVAEELKLYYGRTENVRVIFNGVEMPTPPAGQTRSQIRSAMRGRLGLADDEPVFLTIATNFDLKGVDHAIAALGELRRQTGRGVLLAVGSQASARLTGQVSTLGLADAVHFAPPAVDIFPWYAAADICVLLSWYDACSRVVLEACRLGIPSITTAFNGAAEALAGGAGIVVASPADIPSVVNAMRKMLDQATLTDLAGAAAGVGEQLSMARHVDELVKIYSQITETK